MSNRARDIFFDKDLRKASDNEPKIPQPLADVCQYTELFLAKKLTKHERHAKETFINNSLVKERVFYALNGWLVSSKIGISFFRQGSSEHFRQ